MIENLEAFKEVVACENEREKNEFFSKLLKDRTASLQLLLFFNDAISRLALLDRECVEKKVAKQLASFMPMLQKFFKAKKFNRGNDIEGMEQEVYALNYEFVQMRRLVIYFLEHYGAITLSRAAWGSVDEMDLVSRYNSELDSMQLGTVAQSKKWKTLGEVKQEEENKMSEEEFVDKEADEKAREGALPTLSKEGDLWCVSARAAVPTSNGAKNRSFYGHGDTPEEALVAFNIQWTKWPTEGGAGRLYSLEMAELRKVDEDCEKG